MTSSNKLKLTNSRILYYIVIIIIFIYIFSQFLSMNKSNIVYKIYNDYIMNKYCIIIIICLIALILQYDKITSILLFILILIPFKHSIQEFFDIQPQPTFEDDIKTNILNQIKSQIDFDPMKTPLTKAVIYNIYNKYFDNDIFVKLQNLNNDSKQYITEGKFPYVPKPNKVDFDITTYQKLLQDYSNINN